MCISIQLPFKGKAMKKTTFLFMLLGSFSLSAQNETAANQEPAPVEAAPIQEQAVAQEQPVSLPAQPPAQGELEIGYLPEETLEEPEEILEQPEGTCELEAEQKAQEPEFEEGESEEGLLDEEDQPIII